MDDTQASPPTVERLWPDPASGPYRLRLTFGEVNGKPAVLGVELWGCEPIPKPWLPAWEGLAPPDPVAVSAEAVRLPLGALLDAWADLHLRSEQASQLLYGAALEGGDQVRKFDPPALRGRPRLSQEFLGRVARVYREALAGGDRSPAVTVAEQLGARHPSTARSWISRARKAGLLEEEGTERGLAAYTSMGPTSEDARRLIEAGGEINEEELQRAIKSTIGHLNKAQIRRLSESLEEQQETPQ